jgi:hypothetical protein
MRSTKLARVAGCLAAVAVSMSPAVAEAQYQAPPPDPGFRYIFDGTATGSDASFDKWRFASGSLANSDSAGRATLDANAGSFIVNTSPFGAYWYTAKAFGDAVFRIHYTVQDIPTSTPNGGVMIRTPYPRYDGANTTAVLAQKPTGFNYDLCPGALAACGLTTPAASVSYNWAGIPGPFPPAATYTGGYCARQTAAGVYTVDGANLNGANGQPLTVNGNANNDEHWLHVYCGHEVQINESLNGGAGLNGASSDAIKTGSIYGFRNLNAKQSGTGERQGKGVWHTMEIRTIGEQFTILIDGVLRNQFDNAIPKINTRAGDAPTMARQLPIGYIALQTHGGNDRISYREIEVKEFAKSDLPVNTVAPKVTGTGFRGHALTCDKGTWTAAPGTEYWTTWYQGNKVLPTNPRYHAPSATDYNNFTTPAEPMWGTAALPWTDWQIVGTSDTYTPTAADVGKAIYCQVSANNGGATVFKTAGAPDILAATDADTSAGATVASTLALTIGGAATFPAFTPGVAKDYDASTTATVISTANTAALGVSDASATATGHLVNGTFSLPSALQAKATSAAGTSAPMAAVGGSAAPTPLLTYAAPVSNDQVALAFRQTIGVNDALRTGTYSKTLTFTLSTTEP